jgi:hypothetical protein
MTFSREFLCATERFSSIHHEGLRGAKYPERTGGGEKSPEESKPFRCWKRIESEKEIL